MECRRKGGQGGGEMKTGRQVGEEHGVSEGGSEGRQGAGRGEMKEWKQAHGVREGEHEEGRA